MKLPNKNLTNSVLHPTQKYMNTNLIRNYNNKRTDQMLVAQPGYLIDSADSLVLISLGHWDTYGLSCKQEGEK